MAVRGRQRHLVLLRHAKSKWPHGVPDHDRPLAGRGRRNAQAVGEWFVAEGPEPELVLCSDAVRARHTWEIVSSVLPRSPQLRLRPDLYGADRRHLLDVVRQVPDSVRTLVLVGHEPTMSDTSDWLAGPGSDRGALRRLREKFPTGGVAVLRFESPWGKVGPRGGVLERFEVPRR